jgi:hypothetical protein
MNTQQQLGRFAGDREKGGGAPNTNANKSVRDEIIWNSDLQLSEDCIQEGKTISVEQRRSCKNLERRTMRESGRANTPGDTKGSDMRVDCKQ